MSGRVLLLDQSAEPEAQFLGLKLHAVSTPQVTSRILRAVAEKERLTITYLNPNYVVATGGNPELAAAINEFDLVLADGIGVVWGARVLGLDVRERLSTNSVCYELFQHCSRERLPLKVFLLGARPRVVDQAAENLRSAFPPVTVIGSHHGWFEDFESEAVVNTINALEPDLLVASMGTPRQQLWVRDHREQLACPVIMTGGGYIDCLSASAFAYYPRWIERAKLNWLYRLCTEPRHVWKRYTVEAAVFSGLILMQLMRRRTPPPL